MLRRARELVEQLSDNDITAKAKEIEVETEELPDVIRTGSGTADSP